MDKIGKVIIGIILICAVLAVMAIWEIPNKSQNEQNLINATGINVADNNSSTTENKSSAETNANKPDSKSNNTQSGSGKLSSAELNNIANFLNDKNNNGFVQQEYDATANINIEQAVRDTDVGKFITSSDPEYADVVKGINENIRFDIKVYTKANIENWYKEKTSQSISSNKKGINLDYCKERNLYYTNHSDTSYSKVQCKSGTLENGNYKVIYVNNDMKYQVTLKKKNGKYIFVSNLPL